MEIKRTKLEMYQVEVVFAIGTLEEIKFVIPTKKTKLTKSLVKVVPKVDGIDETIYVGVVTDSYGLRKIEDKAIKVKEINRNFHQIMRELIDSIIEIKDLSFNDYRNSANLAGYLVTMFEEAKDNYLKNF